MPQWKPRCRWILLVSLLFLETNRTKHVGLTSCAALLLLGPFNGTIDLSWFRLKGSKPSECAYEAQSHSLAILVMFINRRPGYEHLAVIASGTVLGWLGYHGYFRSSTTNSHTLERLPQAFETGTQESIPIPPEYGVPYGSADENGQPGSCSDTASAEYLRDFRTHAVKQCSSRSGHSIYCFHGTINVQDRDVFCIAQNVVLDEETKHFSLECDKKLPEKQSPKGVFDFGEMQRQSGPGAVFERYFDIGRKPESLSQSPLQVEEHQEEQSTYTVLIKREGTREGTAGFWDSLMEIMSMTLSMDILRMSSDTRLGDSFIKAPGDLPRTKVIMLDDLPEGPLYDMWAFFSASEPIRFKDILDDRTRAEALLSAHTAIVPLPGRSNPLSQIDQNAIPDCRYSRLARTFARRVLRNYGVLYPHGGNDISKVVRVTLIAGTGPRRIRDTDHLLEALRRAFPNVIAREVDFGGIPMAEQLQIAQSTDVLVGAHGGGLSHMMFMREDKGAVVEIRPLGLSATNHSAHYKNLAALLGRQHFEAEAEVVPFGQGGSRNADMEKTNGKDRPKAVEFELIRRDMELSISEDDFVAGIGRAIEALIVPGQV